MKYIIAPLQHRSYAGLRARWLSCVTCQVPIDYLAQRTELQTPELDAPEKGNNTSPQELSRSRHATSHNNKYRKQPPQSTDYHNALSLFNEERAKPHQASIPATAGDYDTNGIAVLKYKPCDAVPAAEAVSVRGHVQSVHAHAGGEDNIQFVPPSPPPPTLPTFSVCL